jgi:hypothetical protein
MRLIYKNGGMILTDLIAIVTLLSAISVASERLVEIVKAFVLPSWFQEVVMPAAGAPAAEVVAATRMETRRKARIHILAVVCGIVTALLASPVLKNYTALFNSGGDQTLIIVALGFFASGGSSLWNTVLEYLLKVKSIKDSDDKMTAARADKLKATAEKARADTEKAQAEAEKARAETEKIKAGG